MKFIMIADDGIEYELQEIAEGTYREVTLKKDGEILYKKSWYQLGGSDNARNRNQGRY